MALWGAGGGRPGRGSDCCGGRVRDFPLASTFGGLRQGVDASSTVVTLGLCSETGSTRMEDGGRPFFFV